MGIRADDRSIVLDEIFENLVNRRGVTSEYI